MPFRLTPLLGLLLAALNVAHAQNERPAMWTVSSTAPTCPTTIANSAIDQDIQGRLRAAGIFVSRVHTVTLSADVDCVPVLTRPVATFRITQCIDLSQRVLPASARSRATTLAKIWHSCETQVCRVSKCESQTHAGLGKLMDTAIADWRDLRIAYSPPERVSPSPVLATALDTPSKAEANRVIWYYLFYILTCIAVLVHWEARRIQY